MGSNPSLPTKPAGSVVELVYCTGLENQRGVMPTVGSNPTASATA